MVRSRRHNATPRTCGKNGLNRAQGAIDAKEDKMAKVSPMEYFRQVKSEMKKVTWPSRKETTVSTIAVFIMVFIAAIFLFFADQVMAFAVRTILSFGAGL